MATKIDLLRPDDLLNLHVEATNLRLDSTDPLDPVLVVDDPQRTAFLAFIFPPQTIAERAYFEAAIVKPPVGPAKPIVPETDPDKNPPDPDSKLTDIETPDPPGFVNNIHPTVAQLGHPSRLAFTILPGTRIPFSTEGLLDWSKLELNVNPIAAIGPNPSQQQIANAPAIHEPAPNETALELPYRLVISPNRGVVWNHRPKPFTTRGRTELWHTRLQLKTPDGPVELSREVRAPLRAVWSPDYDPIKRPDPFAKDPDLGRTAMSLDDRHQIVILTSAFHGYDVEVELGIFQAPFNPGLNPALAVSSKKLPGLKVRVPYVPKPFEAEQLMLTPLGGWLRSRGYWNPPRTAPPSPLRPRLDFVQVFSNLQRALREPQLIAAPLADEFLFLPGFFKRPEPQQLDLSEWVHVATQGRDHYVRIVYEGELWPYRHRAALVKVTERKFKEKNGIFVAYLMQRMFIVVREPVKFFTNRDSPFRRVELTTTVTPEIADPAPSRIPGTTRSFWVEVMTSGTTRAKLQFHAIGTDAAGDAHDCPIPLMFVSISDLPDFAPAATEKVALAYNDKVNISIRSAVTHGQKITFAERDKLKPTDNTQLVTNYINFVVDKAGNPPRMLKAEVKIPQVQELLGTDTPTTIRYFQGYVANNFDAATGVFAEVVKEDLSKFNPNDPFAAMVADTQGVEFSSDKAGGFATPNLGVSTLTRSLGPLAGEVKDVVANSFKPADFFKGVKAQLFGTFDLIKLLPLGSFDQNAPKLRTETRDIPGGKLLIARLEWEPDFLSPGQKKLDLKVAAIEKDYKGVTRLLINGRLEKPLTLGPPPPDGVKFEMTGKLNAFRVTVLDSVAINFVEFGFESRTNKKTDVSVKLDPETPIEFFHDLAFVEELRKAVPPDLFGKGPSLDISPTGIRAGFAFALPPAAVGVFSLKDVSLGAALTLPFLDGKPSFDFNVSERAHPFLLAVAIFGGGGFFHLELDTAGIKLLEAAFEFGATAALDLGVASGEVHIMAGIYFAMARREGSTELACILSGYLRMGGSLSVLGIIKISVEFVLSFTYDGVRDKAYGRATLTVHVEVLFFSVSVELTVERAFGGKSGDPHFKELFNTADTWSEYALAFA